MSEGEFCRRESPSQTKKHALLQIASGEIWGRPARNTSASDIPSVKAYRGSLPPGERGIDFTTAIAPHKGSGSPIEARWYYPHTEGVMLRQKNNEDYAAISANIVNKQP